MARVVPGRFDRILNENRDEEEPVGMECRRGPVRL